MPYGKAAHKIYHILGLPPFSSVAMANTMPNVTIKYLKFADALLFISSPELVIAAFASSVKLVWLLLEFSRNLCFGEKCPVET